MCPIGNKMNNSSFIPPPLLVFNKPGLTAISTIREVNSHTLLIEHNPNRFPLIGFIFFGILTAVFAALRLNYAYFSGLAFIIFGYERLVRRSIRCEIDTQAKIITYDRGGWAGLPWGRQTMTCRPADIGHLEMQRHIRRGGDTFQVVLWLFGFKIFPLTHDDLSFSECQRFAEIVRDFANPRLPISAAD
jgi:hypothetical protein